jgi:2-iminobutanoate/2-iminopropanoate deaminase
MKKIDQERAMITTIQTDKAPKAIGPYAQAVRVPGWIFTSGQIALTPEGDEVGEDVALQTQQVLTNLRHLLQEAGADLSDVVKTTIYLADINDFERVNAVYADYFGDHRPARSTVEVSRLPRGVKVEIDCIAAVS